MKKFIISVLGEDSPGIIAAVTRVLHEQNFNIEDVSQTILQDQFSCFFIASGPDAASPEQLIDDMQDATDSFDLLFNARDLAGAARPEAVFEYEPFVVTTRGPDRKGLVAGITEVFAAYGVNVIQLRAVFRGGDEPGNNIMIYEVDIPLDTDQKEFRKALCARAEELDMEISIQHKNIFEAINRV